MDLKWETEHTSRRYLLNPIKEEKFWVQLLSKTRKNITERKNMKWNKIYHCDVFSLVFSLHHAAR